MFDKPAQATGQFDERDLAILRSQLASDPVTIFVSGSRVEGLGNRYSDVDLFVVGDQMARSQAPALRKRHYVDCEFHSLDELINLAAYINELRDMREVPAGRLDLYYRTAIGVPVSGRESFERLQAHFSKDIATHIYAKASSQQACDYLREGTGALECHDYLSAFFLTRSAQACATNAYLAKQGEGYPNTKWRFEKALRRFGRGSNVYEELWGLRNLGERSVRDYVRLVTGFCQRSGIDLQRRLEDTSLRDGRPVDHPVHPDHHVQHDHVQHDHVQHDHVQPDQHLHPDQHLPPDHPPEEVRVARRPCEVAAGARTSHEQDSPELLTARFVDQRLGALFTLMYDIAGAAADGQIGLGVEQCRRALYAAIDVTLVTEIGASYAAGVTALGPEGCIARWRRIVEQWGSSSPLTRELWTLERAAPESDEACKEYVGYCKVWLDQRLGFALDYSKQNLHAILKTLFDSADALAALGCPSDDTLQMFGLQGDEHARKMNAHDRASWYVEGVWSGTNGTLVD